MRAKQDKAKVGGFAALHGFIYTTRANIAHEIAEQIRARIVRTPAEKKMGGRESSTRADGTELYFLFCLFAMLEFYLVGVGAPLSRRCQAHPFSSHNQKSPLGEEIFSMHIISLKDSSWRR